jgi:hypothetical protein
MNFTRFGLFVVVAALMLPRDVCSQATVLNPLPAAQLQQFYHLPEGGAAMPMAWYRWLEVVDSTTGQSTGQTFPERMGDYGFLEDDASDLPVGFGTVSLDFLGGLPGLSINCAACHVGEIHYQAGSETVRLRIVGGPNLADVRRFSQDTYQSALTATATPGRLLRFLTRAGRLQPETVALVEELPFVAIGEFDCVPASPSAVEYTRAVEAVIQRGMISPVPRTLAANSPRSWDTSLLDVFRNLQLIRAELKYFTAQGQFSLSTNEGFGRLDAFATVRFLLFPDETADFPFTAPVSAPHLWGISRKKWLHWNNNTNSTLQWNIAQALGMGAVQSESGVNNVLFPNLDVLESIAQQIVPPRWPSQVFGPLDRSLVAQGRTLFQARCAGCHNAGTVDPSSGLVEFRLLSLSEAGTDPNAALNFHQPVGDATFAAALAGRLQALESWYYNRREPGQPVPIATRVAWSGGRRRLPAEWRDPLADDVDAPVYAALPLAGVWATAPYLHNNSVPTLRDLLRPSAERPQVFMVGHRGYDPVNVGYVQDIAPQEIPVLYRFDASEAGNSNTGHEGPAFGAEGLSPAEIDALLEYLKSF